MQYHDTHIYSLLMTSKMFNTLVLNYMYTTKSFSVSNNDNHNRLLPTGTFSIIHHELHNFMNENVIPEFRMSLLKLSNTTWK